MNTIEDLLRFMSKFHGEAEGRARTELSDDDKAVLTALAEGKADEGQRETAIPLLSKNEMAMEYLADLLR